VGRGAELAARARAVHAERAMVLGRTGESCRAGQRGMGQASCGPRREAEQAGRREREGMLGRPFPWLG